MSLSGGQIAFYATTATAIPVLLLAYVFELSALSRRASDSIDEAATQGRDAVCQRIDTAGLESGTAKGLKLAVNFFSATLAGSIRRTFVQIILVVLVLCPAGAEIVCLNALADNSATHSQYVIAWVGLGCSGIGVLAPIIATTFIVYRPMFMFGLVLKTTQQLRTGGEPLLEQEDQSLVHQADNERE